ncbi:hypothetical protein JQV27_14755 [Sulfitobacter mediterraneus]|jgi:hypothetical protein|nr:MULTISPECIES: hypothetical protein [Sulfitobacter]MBM1633585.1 hypothetical protein [Sulfitobacter mediterraneus]MBM1641900.1 hypothetical protein [Sulfitobacter mediterraneus]MBM1645449.1 hypothetical protein [Sulfitobacter mediterraneus]MBM1650019.1 hypothetical protein [Sulfitobacter mediterraneus]MBM1653518.1 hypothetical protein [Sulfitobacter mediterraneus]
MKAMFTSFAAIIVIAVVASFGLERAGFSSEEVNAGPSVRLGKGSQ